MKQFFGLTCRATAMCGLALVGLVLSTSDVSAAMIVRNGETGLNGTGYGNIDTILSLQGKGNSTTELGSVLWGGTQDVITGDALDNGNAKTQTLTAQALLNAGISSTADNLSLVFQVNMAGQTDQLLLRSFAVVFQSDSSTELFRINWDSTSSTDNPDQAITADRGPDGQPLGGVGGGTSGHVFNIYMDDAQRTQFFGTGTNRIGLIVDPAITAINDGPDYFFLQRDDRAGPNPVPAPAGLILALTGMPALGLGAWLRRRRAAAAAV